MIQGKMEYYDIKAKGAGTDAYGQASTTFTTVLKTIEVSISLITQTLLQEDARYIDSTHIGLTFDKTLYDGLLLTKDNKSYLIKLVNNDGKMSQLTLKEV